MKDRIRDRNRHDVVRANAIEITSEKAPVNDIRVFKELYEVEDSLRVKRAILLGLRRLASTERNHFLGYCRPEGWSSSLCAEIAKEA